VGDSGAGKTKVRPFIRRPDPALAHAPHPRVQMRNIIIGALKAIGAFCEARGAQLQLPEALTERARAAAADVSFDATGCGVLNRASNSAIDPAKVLVCLRAC
jgi:hypothetical protein